MDSKPPWTIGRVARRLGVSPNRVRQHDDRLKPLRTVDGVRLYDPDVIEAFALEREAARRARAEHAA